MIASVRGTVVDVLPNATVLEVGGVGVLVQCAPATLVGLRVGHPAALATSLVVRETELTLYGFASADEREVFEALQTAAGVGPRLAQAVLAVHTPDAVRRAVASEDLSALTLVPGIGRKGAQRIVLDLRDRLGPAPVEGAGGNAGADAVVAGREGVPEQVKSALVALGYSAREADEALQAAGAPAGESVAGVLRAALATLRRA
jgi:Holliday junction DNA helicase RuvA